MLLLAGPAGAGKSTLARAWCRARARAAHVQLDDVRSLVVSGFVDPRDTDHPDQPAQWRASVAASCALVRSFAEDGIDVAVDDVLEPDAVGAWLAGLDGLDVRLVVVLPPLDVVLARGAARDKHVPEHLVRRQHADCSGWDRSRVIDTVGQSVAESLAALLALAADPATRIGAV